LQPANSSYTTCRQFNGANSQPLVWAAQQIVFAVWLQQLQPLKSNVIYCFLV